MPKRTPGTALKEAREAVDVSLDYAAAFTQFKLGKSLGISREQLRKMEHGAIDARNWNVAALLALADCYGCSVERIMPPEVNKAGLPFLVEAWQSVPEQVKRRSRCNTVLAGQAA